MYPWNFQLYFVSCNLKCSFPVFQSDIQLPSELAAKQERQSNCANQKICIRPPALLLDLFFYLSRPLITFLYSPADTGYYYEHRIPKEKKQAHRIKVRNLSSCCSYSGNVHKGHTRIEIYKFNKMRHQADSCEMPFCPKKPQLVR